MSLMVKTMPLKGKTFYYIQCSICKKDRMINVVSAAPNVISYEKYKNLCGCTCNHIGKKIVVTENVDKPAKRKVMTAMIQGKEMTVKEIADTFNLSQSTVRNRIRSGKTGEEIIASTK